MSPRQERVGMQTPQAPSPVPSEVLPKPFWAAGAGGDTRGRCWLPAGTARGDRAGAGRDARESRECCSAARGHRGRAVLRGTPRSGDRPQPPGSRAALPRPRRRRDPARAGPASRLPLARGSAEGGDAGAAIKHHMAARKKTEPRLIEWLSCKRCGSGRRAPGIGFALLRPPSRWILHLLNSISTSFKATGR